MDAVTAPAVVSVYMVRVRRFRTTLFIAPESIAAAEAGQRDRIRAFVRRLMAHRNAVVRWLGRVFRAAHDFYRRLEDRIDPLERMLKALKGPSALRVLHAGHSKARDEFHGLLRGQATKHTVWLAVDGVVSAAAVAVSPFLAWIPGPYVLLYYPLMRLLSHRRALEGARNAMNAASVVFEESAELGRLEDSLRSGASPSNGCARAGIRVTGLDAYLERVS